QANSVSQQAIELFLGLRRRRRQWLGGTCSDDIAKIPPWCRFAGAPRSDHEEVAGRKFSDAAKNTARRRDVVETKIVRQCVAIELRTKCRVGKKSLELRPEQKAVAKIGVVHRLDAKPVPYQNQPPFSLVPERKREHSDQPRQCRGNAKMRAGFQYHLGI